MKFGLAAFLVSALVLSCAAAAATGALAPQAPSAKRGRTIFVEKGCYACHGYNGQGGVTGPKLAPDPMELEVLKSFIRNAGPTQMPAYSQHLVNDAEAAHIHAWLASQPRTKSPADIPLLSK